MSADVDIDPQQSSEVVLCVYAEFCRASYRTAKIIARHAPTHQQVHIQDLICAMRREIGHPNGCINSVRPLLDYIFENHCLPRRQLIDGELIRRIFEHRRGAWLLLQQSASREKMGDALYRCLLIGSVLSVEFDDRPQQEGGNNSETSDNVGYGGSANIYDGTSSDHVCVDNTLDDDGGSDHVCVDDDDGGSDHVCVDDDDGGSDHVCVDNALDDDDGSSSANMRPAYEILQRHFCLCDVCRSVSVTRRRWSTYEPTDELQRYLKEYCGELEQRLENEVLDTAHGFFMDNCAVN